MSAPPVLAAKLSCVSCVSWLIFSSQVFVPFAKRLAPFTLKSQQFEYEHEHRDAEHEHEFAPKVTSSFFRGSPPAILIMAFFIHTDDTEVIPPGSLTSGFP